MGDEPTLAFRAQQHAAAEDLVMNREEILHRETSHFSNLAAG